MIPPSEMLAELVRLMGTDGFWSQIGFTLRNILAAAVAAMVAGFAGGVALHALPRVSVNGCHQSRAALRGLLSGVPFLAWNRGRRLNVG